MTDLKNEIAEKIRPFVRGNSVEMNSKHAFEAADVAIETVVARIPPLVWDQYCTSGSSSAKTVFNTEYVAEITGPNTVGLWSPDEPAEDSEPDLGYFADVEAAKAAANAHHVAQLCKGMGIE